MEEENPDLVSKALLAEQCDRYDDMASAMKSYVLVAADKKAELTETQRNLLSVAYKNVVGARRSAWRIVRARMTKKQDDALLQETGSAYIEQIEMELESTCREVLDLLLENLLPHATSTRAVVFFEKMRGDYYRYLAEIRLGEKLEEAKKQCMEAYQKAYEKCEAEMEPADPIRLGLALNFSVFYYEVAGDKEAARQLAKNAFDEAIAQLDSISDSTYKDSTLIMQLLRDNLTLWTEESGRELDAADEEPA